MSARPGVLMNAGSDVLQTAEIARLSDRLTDALRDVIRASPLRGLGPMEVARALEIDKTLASRLMTALRARDSLAALSALPGTGPLRRFINAAKEHGASPRAAKTAQKRVQDFEQVLQRTFGTRTHLDAALSDALPEARRRQQDTARQSVYRGMALLKGVSFDLTSNTWIVHPGRGGDRVDIQVVAAFIGIRRFRPTARVQLATSHAQRPARAPAGLLTEFCRPTDLTVSTLREGAQTIYEITSLPIGRDAAADVFLAEFIPDAARRTGAEDGWLAYGDVVGHPYKRLALNILLHRDAWPGCTFSVRAYDTAGRGIVNIHQPEREADRFPLDAAIERGQVIRGALRSSLVPHYPEVLRHVTAPLGWELDEFQLFSCEIAYPVYGAQIMMVREPSGG